MKDAKKKINILNQNREHLEGIIKEKQDKASEQREKI